MSLASALARLAFACVILTSCTGVPGGQVIPADRVETVQVTLLNANHKVFSLRANKGMQNFTVEVTQAAGLRTATGTFQSPGELAALMRSASDVVGGTIAEKSSSSEIEGDVWLVTVTSGPVGIDVAVGPQPQSTALRNSLEQLTQISKQLAERAMATLPPF